MVLVYDCYGGSKKGILVGVVLLVVVRRHFSVQFASCVLGFWLCRRVLRTSGCLKLMSSCGGVIYVVMNIQYVVVSVYVLALRYSAGWGAAMSEES